MGRVDRSVCIGGGVEGGVQGQQQVVSVIYPHKTARFI